ncbi:MAG: prephenate dehydratase [Rhodothermales bacterium]
MRVAFQGETGAFSEEATRACYPDAQVVPCATFDAVFEAVASGAVDRAVLPIENSLHGSVHANYDLLRDHKLVIIGELNLRIRHNLMALPGTSLADVVRVYSHPQALGQCRTYLKTHVPNAEQVPSYDTAGSAKMVAERGEVTAAAIASRAAANEYGLDILAAGIESNHQNYTRFLVLVRPEDVLLRAAGDALKTSVLYVLADNVPGALFKSLAVFALRDLDLYKIESRPLIGHPGQYLFYLDLEGHADDEPVRRALDHLREVTRSVRVLGSYPTGPTVS